MNVAIGPRTSTQDGAHPDNHLPKNVTCDAGTEFVNTAHCATCRIGIRMLYFGVQYWGQELEGIIIVLSRVGVDAGAALGVNTDIEDGVLKDMWKSVGRWGVERVDKISVGLSTVAIYSEHGHLADITLPSFTLPLTVNPPPDPTWLTTMSVPVLIKPTKDPATLARFVRDSWRDGVVNVRATVNETVVDALGGWLHLSREHVSSTVRMSLPHLPPPDRVPVHLIAFLIESAATHLALSGNATIENPLPEDMNLHATVPELPFTVFLHAPNDTLAPVANATTAPITLAHPNVSIAISGFVLPIPPVTQAALSNFISLYLRAQDNPIVISTPFLPGLMFPTTFPAPYPKPQVLRNVTIRNMMLRYSPDGKGGMLASGTVFGRAVLPRGIKVGIDVKRIFPDVLVFDGEVSGSEDDQEETGRAFSYGRHIPHPRLPHLSHLTNLPLPSLPTIPSIPYPSLPSLPRPSLPSLPSLPSDVPIPHIPVPGFPIGRKHHTHTSNPPPSPPLPSPLPPRAFAHIRPDDWLPAISIPVERDDDEGTAVEVEAKIVDVPLQVLEGREKEFRNFVGKVIFSSGGALAGVQGTAAVGVRIDGLPFKHGEGGEMELTGLPFEGSVRVGKKSTF